MICSDCGNDHEHQRQDYPLGVSVELLHFLLGHYYDLPPGSQGQVIGHCDDGRAVVNFGGSVHTFHFPAGSLRVVGEDSLSFGDTGPVVMPPVEWYELEVQG